MTILIITIVLLCLAMIYIANRSNKVLKFRIALMDASQEWTLNHVNDIVTNKEQPSFNWLITPLPSFNKMVFQFWKPLTIEHWLTKEQIDKLSN